MQIWVELIYFMGCEYDIDAGKLRLFLQDNIGIGVYQD